MRRARGWLIAANLLIALAIGATYWSDLGHARWHDNVAYVALALGALAILPLWKHRRPTTLILASTGAWSTLTGILLVYVTWRMPNGRWMTWWHGVTSVAFAIAFLAHWARNHPRLLGLARRLGGRPVALTALALAWCALALLAATTLAPMSRAGFSERVAQDWSDVSLGAALAVSLLVIVFARSERVRARLERDQLRNRARGAVDLSLLLSMWFATLTGFALLYAGRGLRGVDAYWLTWAWHVALSALLAALVLAHATFNVRPLASHAR